MKQDVFSTRSTVALSAALHQSYIRPSLWILALSASQLHRFSPSSDSGSATSSTLSRPSRRRFRAFSPTSKVLVRHKAKKGEIEDATGLTQIVNQSGSASGRMDGHVAELSGA
ncbi:unnamed protein product [Microthlaspi erraticum]|uniref:Uncharacterized protein n=1 Tax=Microthlaspi erraticum TaxID=1685480 RepID=A0A6D2HW53_9BRAS|nr:unnamed protein product [Microthlaspi erraticum]